MTDIINQPQLVSLCLALIGEKFKLSPAEIALARRTPAVRSPRIIGKCRDAIRACRDPLGEAFTSLRSPEVRRPLGATYTPAPIVQAMLLWASRQVTPARIVDPGAGSGRFLLSAAAAFPKAQLVGVEIDPLAALTMRANLAACGLEKRSKVEVIDYRAFPLPKLDGPTLFIGNPPYVRHHDIAADAKEWYGRVALSYGIKASKLAGLHLHFFLRTLQLAADGDVGCFITSAEWLDVNYGEALRRLLATELGGTDLTVIDPKAVTFTDAATTSAITGFRIRRRAPALRVRTVATAAELAKATETKQVPWAVLEKSPRWSIIIKPHAAPPSGHVELGELCRVHRGQVTGSNELWIAGAHSVGLPSRFLLPTVTRARELLDAGDVLDDVRHLKRVIDLPVDLDELLSHEREPVLRFLRWAEKNGGKESYIAKHRRAWWAVRLKEPAPILCTYMARRPPAFVRNPRNVRHINIAHGLYPREPLASEILDALASWLRSKVLTAQGRTYAGGLTKFEPKEVERLTIPAPHMFTNGAFS